jgi:membrane-bound lytic murein transglycosylase D
MTSPKCLVLYIFSFFCLFQLPAFAQTSTPSQYKDASSELKIPTEAQLFKDDPDPVVMSAQIAVRLKKIQHVIPLDYNEHVQKFISYNTNVKRKGHIAKMMGRAKKFFPIFEPILAEYGIPDEMKYLAVVESALNPFAVSPKGASGLWQFMYSTGLRYDLNISKKVDERRDPYKACEGAARYLKEMYNLYGSWHLAIASYNCGAGNVNRAIKKAGGSMNFWDIRPYLPAETQAYVPTFIAMVYAMKYSKQYGISPMTFEREATQRVTVREKITISDLESILGIPRQILIDENPSLLTTLIPSDFTLNLPVSRISTFTQFQDSLYVKAEDVTTAQKLVVPRVVKPESAPKEMPLATLREPAITKEKIPEEDKATKEAADDATFFEKLKSKLKTKKTSSEKPGAKSYAKTKSGKPTETVKNEKITSKNSKQKDKKTAKEEALSKKEAARAKEKMQEWLKEDDDNYRVVVYKVKKGDNPGYIASWYHCKVKEIRKWNELNGNFIDVDDELLIYVHNTDYKKFVRFNYLSNRLKDMLSEKIQTQEEKDVLAHKEQEYDSARLIDKINPAKIFSKSKDCFETHRIRPGENLWIIAQKYDDVTVQDLMEWNGYKKTPVLHKGDEIKVRRIECQ